MSTLNIKRASGATFYEGDIMKRLLLVFAVTGILGITTETVGMMGEKEKEKLYTDNDDDIELDLLKGFEKDQMSMNIIRSAFGKELLGFESDDKKALKDLAEKCIKNNPDKYQGLANIKKTRSGNMQVGEDAQQDLNRLKTQVLAAYIESKKGEASMAKMQYDLAVDGAKKADEHERWSRKVTASSLGISACSIVTGVVLGTINTALAIYIAANT